MDTAQCVIIENETNRYWNRNHIGSLVFRFDAVVWNGIFGKRNNLIGEMFATTTVQWPSWSNLFDRIEFQSESSTLWEFQPIPQGRMVFSSDSVLLVHRMLWISQHAGRAVRIHVPRDQETLYVSQLEYHFLLVMSRGMSKNYITRFRWRTILCATVPYYWLRILLHWLHKISLIAALCPVYCFRWMSKHFLFNGLHKLRFRARHSAVRSLIEGTVSFEVELFPWLCDIIVVLLLGGEDVTAIRYGHIGRSNAIIEVLIPMTKVIGGSHVVFDWNDLLIIVDILIIVFSLN